MCGSIVSAAVSHRRPASQPFTWLVDHLPASSTLGEIQISAVAAAIDLDIIGMEDFDLF